MPANSAGRRSHNMEHADGRLIFWHVRARLFDSLYLSAHNGFAEIDAQKVIVRMRLGILGGTFDPIHNAHLFIAESARAALNLDRVLFIPTGAPPHKPNHRLAP